MIQKDIESTLFIKYCCYAFGTPILIIIIAYVIDMSDLPDRFKIGIGDKMDSCWMKDDRAVFYYSHLPISLILIINVIFYSLSAYKVFRSRLKIERASRISFRASNTGRFVMASFN
jgi:hypothetical protein